MPISGPDSLTGGFVAATVGAAGLWLANRLVGKAAVQTALNAGFKDLMNQLEQDRDYWRGLVASEREQHSRTINEMQVKHAREIALLEGQILNLTQGYESLKSHLRREGYVVPGDPPARREMIVLEGPKKPD